MFPNMVFVWTAGDVLAAILVVGFGVLFLGAYLYDFAVRMWRKGKSFFYWRNPLK